MIEVRNKPDGSVDEVVMMIGGKCVLHLEYMDDNYIWIGVYDQEGEMAHIRLTAKKRITTVVEIEDEQTELSEA